MNAPAKLYVPILELMERTYEVSEGPIDDSVSVPIRFLNDLNEATTQDANLSVISKWAARILKADRVSIALADGSTGLRTIALNGSAGPPNGAYHEISTTTVGAVFQHMEPVYIPDNSVLDKPDAKFIYELGFQSAVLVPILSGSKCFGTLAASFYKPPQNPKSSLDLMIALARLLANQLMTLDRMEKLAGKVQQDALTGAPNRYYLNDQLVSAWTEWTIIQKPFAFLTLDIDHFKVINDTYGHDVGDEVLCEVVNRLKRHNRNDDSLVRLGGEEFGMLLRGANLQAAVGVSQRFREALDSSPFKVGDLELPVTASFGVSEADEEDWNIKVMMKRADDALYRAKELGRNRVVAFDGSDMVQQ